MIFAFVSPCQVKSFALYSPYLRWPFGQPRAWKHVPAGTTRVALPENTI